MKDLAEVCPLSRGVMSPCGSTPILPITGRHSLSPPSHTRRPIGSPCGSLSQRETYGFTTFHAQTIAWVRFRLFTGGALSAVRELEPLTPDHLPFGPSLLALLGLASTFGLFPLTTFISGSHVLTIPSTLAPDRIGARSRHRPSRLDDHPYQGEATLSQELRTTGLLQSHVLVGYQWQNIGLRPDCYQP